jgi:hypothetical protein
LEAEKEERYQARKAREAAKWEKERALAKEYEEKLAAEGKQFVFSEAQTFVKNGMDQFK